MIKKILFFFIFILFFNQLEAKEDIMILKLKNGDVVIELFSDVAPKFSDRNGGYTRIIRKGFRSGDGAEMVILELVD